MQLASKVAGSGTLALIGGGEFSFGDTLEADREWLGATADGDLGFLPTASGSADYGRHFADYIEEAFGRRVVTVPVYRRRDATRGKNAARIRGCAGVYLGGGVAANLVEVLDDSPALEALAAGLASGMTVVAIATAAQAAGLWVRTLRGDDALPGFGWLPATVIEPNFLPTHDRRLRQLLARPGVRFGIGLPAGSCLMISGSGGVHLVGPVFGLEGEDEDLKLLTAEEAART